MKKSILALLIGALPMIALMGCGGTQGQDADSPDTDNSTQTAEQHDGDADDVDGSDDHGTMHVADQHDDDATDHGVDGHDTADGAHASEQHSHDAHDDTGHDHDESAAGSTGDPANINRDVEITMDDSMRFAPDSLTFKAGETVRFIIRNSGKIPHEFVIGLMSELMEHAEMMRAMPSMQHAEANMLTLAPGAEGELIWRFDDTGTVDFACLIPGHLEAGMQGVIRVE